MSKGGKRPGSGRKRIGKPYPVRLTEAQCEAAKLLGDGNLSRGVRIALDRASLARITEEVTHLGFVEAG